MEIKRKHMKKKTMQTWFAVLFIFGLIAGLIVPTDLKTIAKKMSQSSLKPDVFDIPKKLGQLDIDAGYFKYSALAETDTGSIELIRVDDKIPMHMHSRENHFAYIFKGSAKVTIGNSASEVRTGQMIAIPAGVSHTLERIGDTPVEIILFSTPKFAEKDIAWLESK